VSAHARGECEKRGAIWRLVYEMARPLLVATLLTLVACVDPDPGTGQDTASVEDPGQSLEVQTPTRQARWRLGGRLQASSGGLIVGGVPVFSVQGTLLPNDCDGSDCEADALVEVFWVPDPARTTYHCEDGLVGVSVNEPDAHRSYDNDIAGDPPHSAPCTIEVSELGPVGEPVAGSFEGYLQKCERTAVGVAPTQTEICDEGGNLVTGEFHAIHDPDF